MTHVQRTTIEIGYGAQQQATTTKIGNGEPVKPLNLRVSDIIYNCFINAADSI
jgi:hypothetical protein